MDCKSCPYKRECHELPSDLSCDDVLAIMEDEPLKNMKVTLEIPDETVCVHFTLGLQDGSGWGMASFQMENPEDGGYVRLEMPKESES